MILQANAKFYTQLSTPGQGGEESSDQVNWQIFAYINLWIGRWMVVGEVGRWM